MTTPINLAIIQLNGGMTSPNMQNNAIQIIRLVQDSAKTFNVCERTLQLFVKPLHDLFEEKKQLNPSKLPRWTNAEDELIKLAFKKDVLNQKKEYTYELLSDLFNRTTGAIQKHKSDILPLQNRKASVNTEVKVRSPKPAYKFDAERFLKDVEFLSNSFAEAQALLKEKEAIISSKSAKLASTRKELIDVKVELSTKDFMIGEQEKILSSLNKKIEKLQVENYQVKTQLYEVSQIQEVKNYLEEKEQKMKKGTFKTDSSGVVAF